MSVYTYMYVHIYIYIYISYRFDCCQHIRDGARPATPRISELPCKSKECMCPSRAITQQTVISFDAVVRLQLLYGFIRTVGVQTMTRCVVLFAYRDYLHRESSRLRDKQGCHVGLRALIMPDTVICVQRPERQTPQHAGAARRASATRGSRNGSLNKQYMINRTQ